MFRIEHSQAVCLLFRGYLCRTPSNVHPRRERKSVGSFSILGSMSQTQNGWRRTDEIFVAMPIVGIVGLINEVFKIDP